MCIARSRWYQNLPKTNKSLPKSIPWQLSQIKPVTQDQSSPGTRHSSTPALELQGGLVLCCPVFGFDAPFKNVHRLVSFSNGIALCKMQTALPSPSWNSRPANLKRLTGITEYWIIQLKQETHYIVFCNEIHTAKIQNNMTLCTPTF